MIRLLSTRRVFLLVLALGLFMMAARPISDPDLWWHLRTGQQMVAAHSVPHQDFFSFTRYGQRWVTHEWLAEVTFYLVFLALGWTGLLVLSALLIAATFLVLYSACPGRPYLAGLVVALGAFATIPSWGVRPQMFTLLLAAIFVVLLRRAENRNVNRLGFLWWMVPLQFLWTNLHGGFLLGPVLIGLTLAGWGVETWSGASHWPEVWPRLRRLGLVLVACLAVIPLNPNGFEIYRYPLATLQSRTMMQYIQEWASPNFHSPDFKPFLGLLLLTWLLLAVSRKRLSASQLFLLLATAYASLNASRHLLIFVVVAIPIIAERLHELAVGYGWMHHLEGSPEASPVRKLAINAILVLLLVGFATIRIYRVASQQPRTEASYFPVAATQFIVQHRPPAPLFNSYDWGGYFIAKLYPQYRVFIDGRADLYGSLMDAALSTAHAQGDWQKSLQEYGIRTVVLPPDSELAGVLRLNPGWAKIFEDNQAVIFVRH